MATEIQPDRIERLRGRARRDGLGKLTQVVRPLFLGEAGVDQALLTLFLRGQHFPHRGDDASTESVLCVELIEILGVCRVVDIDAIGSTRPDIKLQSGIGIDAGRAVKRVDMVSRCKAGRIVEMATERETAEAIGDEPDRRIGIGLIEGVHHALDAIDCTGKGLRDKRAAASVVVDNGEGNGAWRSAPTHQPRAPRCLRAPLRQSAQDEAYKCAHDSADRPCSFPYLRSGFGTNFRGDKRGCSIDSGSFPISVYRLVNCGQVGQHRQGVANGRIGSRLFQRNLQLLFRDDFPDRVGHADARGDLIGERAVP